MKVQDLDDKITFILPLPEWVQTLIAKAVKLAHDSFYNEYVFIEGGDNGAMACSRLMHNPTKDISPPIVAPKLQPSPLFTRPFTVQMNYQKHRPVSQKRHNIRQFFVWLSLFVAFATICFFALQRTQKPHRQLEPELFRGISLI